MDVESRGVERVRVAVRVRPQNRREEALGDSAKTDNLCTLDVDDVAGQIYVCKRKSDRATASTATPHNQADRELRCSYDRVFAPESSQSEVFEYLRDSVQQVAQGFNCTIFAYGQTGTGKTHTMLGRGVENGADSAAVNDGWGVIPRAVESLFDELQSIARNGAAAAVVHCSYMQIYNNEVFDLLQENKSRMKEPLAVREIIKGNDKQIYVSGLSEFRVTNLDETLKLLCQGNKNRTIRATEYNEKSSRSHALLQLSAEVESRGAEGPTTIIRRAKLNLVDLAGSEKWDTDVAMDSERCKELTSINQSLSALGNVISALANSKRSHIPYRDSKLTRLLQDSLGGNTRTTVLATISHDVSAIEETISTLLFADRAKCVTLRVKANEVVDDAVLLAQARREIARLKLQLRKCSSHTEVDKLEQKVANLSRENAALVGENKRLKQAIATMKKERGKVRADQDSMPAETTTSLPRGGEQSVHSLTTTLNIETEVTEPLQTIPKPALSEPVGHDAFDWPDEQDQARLLEQIQSERRALEEELERIEQQTSRQAGSQRHGPAIGEDDDICPICQRSIDDHSDGELDACIDEETAAMEIKSKSTKYPDLPPSTPPAVTRPRGPRSPPHARKPASPYLQSLAPKVSAPSPPPRSSLNGASLRLTAQRRSVRDLRKARELKLEGGDESTANPRPVSATTPNKNSDALATNRRQGPIVHQGSKSVKALKTFQALSPYNQSHNNKRAAAPSPPRQSNNHALHEDRVTGSFRDIGLSLLVYKFRYDCWYPCTIVGFDAKRRLHCCQYEYGDKQWQDLAQNKTQVVGRQH